jgi:predicted RNase H-like HicB family nuclease
MRYAIVVEKAGNNYSAYVPDLPGYVATGSTVEETERKIHEAIEAAYRRNDGGRCTHTATDQHRSIH